MDLFNIKISSAFIILLVTIIAGIIPFKKRFSSNTGHEFPIGEAIAAGVFLGAGLIHMLGETAYHAAIHAEHHTPHGHPYPWPFLICGASFLFLLFLEHLGTEFRHKNQSNKNVITLLATIILSVHALFAGAALGIVQNFSSTLILLFAILAHKWAASFSLAIQVNKSNLSGAWRIGYFSIFALMTPLGIVLGENIPFLTQHNYLFEMIFTSLAAGTFLYIGTLHGLSNAPMIKRCCNLREFSFVILGFALMAIVGIWT